MIADGELSDLLRPTWAEVDLDAIRHNFRTIRTIVGPDSMIHGVLKGDAYGCGLVETARTLTQVGVYALAVGNIYEAITLRKAGIRCPILLFANTLPSPAACAAIVEHQLTASITNWEMASALARSTLETVNVYVKVDAGFGRLGTPASELVNLMRAIGRDYKNMRVTGLHAHIPWTLTDEEAFSQFRTFTSAAKSLAEAGMHVPIQMVAGSGIVFRFPQMHLTAVDPGKSLYGFLSPTTPGATQLRPALALKSRIISLRRVSEENGRTRLIGIIPFGTADGFLSALANGGRALVRGSPAPILGLSDAEHTRLDVTAVEGVKLGDAAVLLGCDGTQEITIWEIADRSQLKPTEITRGFSNKIPYLFKEGSRLASVRKAYR